MKQQNYFLSRIYVHLLCTLSPVISILLAAFYGVNIATILLVALICPIPFVPIIAAILHKVGSSPVNLLFGLGRNTPVREKIAGEIRSSKYLKTKGRFAEALETINKALEQDGNNDEALLLKAQILLEGFNDFGKAKLCLTQIIKGRQEPYYHWAKKMLNEIIREKQVKMGIVK